MHYLVQQPHSRHSDVDFISMFAVAANTRIATMRSPVPKSFQPLSLLFSLCFLCFLCFLSCLPFCLCADSWIRSGMCRPAARRKASASSSCAHTNIRTQCSMLLDWSQVLILRCSDINTQNALDGANLLPLAVPCRALLCRISIIACNMSNTCSCKCARHRHLFSTGILQSAKLYLTACHLHFPIYLLASTRHIAKSCGKPVPDGPGSTSPSSSTRNCWLAAVGSAPPRGGL